MRRQYKHVVGAVKWEGDVGDKVVALVTCASAAEAKKIAHAVVDARLAACVNILSSSVSSIYRWKGKVESAQEYLLLMKTSRKRLAQLREEIERLHSYKVPEFIALPIVAGSQAYLAWLDESVSTSPPAKKKGAPRRSVKS